MASLVAGQVNVCDKYDRWSKVLKENESAEKLVVVNFMASWSGPCRFIAPIFAEMAKATSNVYFVKVDVDVLPEVAEEYNIENMPTFVFFKKGEKVDTLVGAKKDSLRAKITQHNK